MIRRALPFLSPLLLLPGAALAQPQRGTAAPAPTLVPAAPSELGAYVAEASTRFSIPEAWIWAVMRAESGGDPRAISPAGAMGLMQIMPATWAGLSARYGLGADPFAPRMNILAGAAYLRLLYDRFGAPGFLAAYNAGPGRYAQWLATGRPLPAETRAYLASLAPVVGAVRDVPPAGVAAPHSPSTDPDAWMRAPIFTPRGADVAPSDPPEADAAASGTPAASIAGEPGDVEARPVVSHAPRSDRLFVPRPATRP